MHMKLFVYMINVSYCMVCAYGRKDNPRALASGLSPVHTLNHIAPVCMCTFYLAVPCELFDVNSKVK